MEAQSVVISDGFAARYSLGVDSEWRTVAVNASIIGSADSVHIRRLDSGEWVSENEISVARLDGALDADLSITPFTNSLPIRRLGLKIGASAEILAAYIEFPQLAVSAELQRYTRLGADRYRYESMHSDFVREIVVDEDGIVISYPGLFRRV